jgi:hypothetical protein
MGALANARDVELTASMKKKGTWRPLKTAIERADGVGCMWKSIAHAGRQNYSWTQL